MVLVVEDDFLVRCSVAERLREAGYTVVDTPSGEEAIALCKSDMAIDIVFTDINLIGAASGWEVAECFPADRPGVPSCTSGELIDHGAVFPEASSLPSHMDIRTSSTPVSSCAPVDAAGSSRPFRRPPGHTLGESMPTSEQHKRRAENVAPSPSKPTTNTNARAY